MQTDRYRTIEAPASSELREKGSRFIGLAYPVSSEDQTRAILQSIRREHDQASHHCYANVLGPGKEFRKSSDDGEPANSAGKPILRAILSQEVSDVLVVVVRYFGGKLLGVPGLIHAYGEAARLALEQSVIIEKMVEEEFTVSFPYNREHAVFRLIRQHAVRIVSHERSESPSVVLAVPKSKAKEVIAHFEADLSLTVRA